MAKIMVRKFEDRDAGAVAQVFFDAIHVGTQHHYELAQRRLWGGKAPQPDRWLSRLKPMTAYVAEMGDEVVGFMTIDSTGLIDLAFVAPAVAGTGVGLALYREVERQAREFEVVTLHTEASLTARPFFERQGWHVVIEQSVVKEGVSLTNFRMQKHLETV